MFSYYGSKSKIVNYYPAPKCDKIIEPFAGSARYSLKYFENEIILVDKYDVVVDIWNWLKQCSPKDILSLPKLRTGDNLKDFSLTKTEIEFLRFLVQQGSVGGYKCYEWGIKSYPQNLKRISEELFKIKHWKIICDVYDNLTNEQATWFIDPPYQVGGHKYKCNNKKIDYAALRSYCENRGGQIIVCENTNANWMSFTPLVEMQGISKRTTEAIWTNDPIMTEKQIKLF